MVTKKQLAALARGRAIRARKIKTKRTKRRRTKKVTKFAILPVIKGVMYGAGAISSISSILTNFPNLKRAIKRLWSGNGNFNCGKMREISANMQREIMMLGITDDPIYHDFAELNKSIHAVDYYREIENSKLEAEEIEKVMAIFKKILAKYSKLVGHEETRYVIPS